MGKAWYNTKVQERRTLRSHRLKLMTAVNKPDKMTQYVSYVVRRLLLHTIFLF